MTSERTIPTAAERGDWLHQLVKCSDGELAQRDIAESHLACARGLPGTEDLDISACLQRLDKWAALVRVGIGNALANRTKFPEFDELSSAEYQVVTIFSVLYRHLGLTLNVDFNEDPYDGSDPRDHFMHAVLMDGYPATCCTAPVIFTAVGRRLGFPIKLVKTREHLFCRWDDGDERFNIEATNQGYFRYSDNDYLSCGRSRFSDRPSRRDFC